MVTRVNVVIVGAGLAGLSAALKAKDLGMSYVVLEGSDRPGGRAKSDNPARHEPPFDVDFGGAYIGQAQNHIQYLARRYELHILPTYLARTREWLFEFSPQRLERFPGNNHLDFPGGRNAGARLVELDTLALELRRYAHDPWRHPHAALLDSMTAEDWMLEERRKYDQQSEPKNDEIGMNPDTAAAFVAAVRCAFSLEPRELSFFFLLYYSALAGSFAALVDVAGGQGAAEGARFMFGSKQLVQKLVDDVGPENVRFRQPVSRIEDFGTGVRVSTEAGSFEADYVIVAMSPPASLRLDYRPRLADTLGGQMREALCERMAGCMGKTIKGFVRFKKPSWRTPTAQGGQGLMGFLLSVGPHETCPVSWTLDNAWDPSDRHFEQFFGRKVPKPEQPENPIYRLMTFIVGDAAEYWTNGKTKADRAKAVIDHLQKAYRFRDDELYDETDRNSNYIEENWLDVSGLGVPAPAAMMPKDTLSQLGGALRAPVGRIHWAGSETALEWCGYMNGAIESGFRAGRDVAALLGRVSPDVSASEPPPRDSGEALKTA